MYTLSVSVENHPSVSGPTISTLSTLTNLETLTLPVPGLLPADQNLVITESASQPISLTTATAGNWTVTGNATPSSGTGTNISFTTTGSGVFFVTHTATGTFPVFSRNLSPVIDGLDFVDDKPKEFTVLQGETRSDTDFFTGVTDAGPTTTQVTVKEKATGIVTDLTTGSLKFNDDVIELDSEILDGAVDVSVAFWLKTPPVSENFVYRSIFNAKNSANDPEFTIATYHETTAGVATNSLIVNTGESFDIVEVDLGFTIDDDAWHHIVVVRDADVSGDGTILVFVDGDAAVQIFPPNQASVPLNPLEIEAGGLIIGQADTGFGFSDGIVSSLDEFGVWRRALNVEQIEEIFTNGIVGNEADLAAYFPLNELGGDVVHDRSPNRRHGVVRSLDATDVTWSTESGVADQDFKAITPGDYDLVVIAHDTSGASDRAEGKIVVSNAAPTAVISPTATITVIAGQTVTLDALSELFPSTDPGDDELTFDWEVTTNNLQSVPTSSDSQFEFTPTAAGLYTVELTATDSRGLASTTVSRDVIVNPSILPLPNVTGNEGDVFTFDASGVSDPAPNAYRSYSWEAKTSGGATVATGDEFSFSFVAPDNDTYTVDFSFTDKVVDPIVVESEPNDTILLTHSLDDAGWNLLFDRDITESTSLPHVTISAPLGISEDFYAFNATAGARIVLEIDDLTIGDFDGSLQLFNVNTGLQVVFVDGLTNIDWIAAVTGRYAVRVNPYGTTPFSYSLHATVEGHPLAGVAYTGTTSTDATAGNLAPAIDFGASTVGSEGTPITLTPIVSDPGSADTFTYVWEVRDAANELVTLDTANNLAAVTFTPADNGDYTAQLTVTDDDGFSTASSTTVDVANVVPVVSAGELQPEIGPNDTRATAQDLDFSDWSLVADPNIQDSDSDSLPHISINVTSDGSFDYYSFTAVAGSQAYFDIDGETFDTELFLYDSVGTLLACNDDAGSQSGDCPAGMFGTSDDLGDGPTGLDSFIGYTFLTSDVYVIGVGAFDSQNTNGEIAGNSPPSGESYLLHVSLENHELGGNFEQQNGNEIQFNGSFTDAGVGDTASTFVWDFGDGTTDDGSLTPSHAYTDSGLYTVTLTVTDKDGGVGTDQFTVDLQNLDPQTFVLDQPAPAVENTTVVFGGSVRDFDGLLHSTVDLEPLRGRIDFGDGVALPLLLRNPSRADGFADYTFDSRHIYTAPGTYTVTATIRDDDGGIATTTTTIEISPDTVAGSDFGDAPDSYQTLIASGGPSHLATGPRLGALRDVESDGQPSADASGDDIASSDDDDGVMFGVLGVGMTMAGINVDLQNASTAFIDAWVDFDGDGVFQSDEQILTSAIVNNVGGPQTLNYTPNADTVSGETLARIRVSSTGGLSVGGAAVDGEVEDYQVTILPRLNVESVVFNDGDSQRSTLTNVVVTFSREVDVAESAFEIRDRASGTVLDSLNVSATLNAMGQTEARLTFGQNGNLAEPAISGQGTLIDGNYVLTIRSLLNDPFGGGVPLASDVEFGAQEVDGFFRFLGDSDGDRDVDGQDYGRFGLTFLKSIGDPQYNSEFDSDGDGDVDGQDYGRFGLRFLRSLGF